MKWQSLIVLGILAVGCSSPIHKTPQNINEINNSDLSVFEEINQIEDTIFINEGIWTSKDDSLSKIEINKKNGFLEMVIICRFVITIYRVLILMKKRQLLTDV